MLVQVENCNSFCLKRKIRGGNTDEEDTRKDRGSYRVGRQVDESVLSPVIGTEGGKRGSSHLDQQGGSLMYVLDGWREVRLNRLVRG